MKLSSFRCPHCGSRRLHRSPRTSLSERFGALLGRYPVRCEECGRRSVLGILLLSKILIAKCPRCLEMHLTSWNITHYHVPAWKKVLLTLGATRYRCNACRYNFVSFKRAEDYRSTQHQ